MPHTRPGADYYKPFAWLIGLRHVTTSRIVTQLSWVARFLLTLWFLAEAFKNNIYLDLLLLLFDSLWKVKAECVV